MFSTDLDNVHASLDVIRQRQESAEAVSLADLERVQAVAGNLGQVAAAMLGTGSDVCEEFSVANLLGSRAPAELVARMRQQLGLDDPASSANRVHAYSAIGIGYRYEGESPVGRIVWHFDDPQSASADLALRERLLEEWPSILIGQPYAEFAFTLDRASTQGSDLIWQVSPARDMPRQLFNLVIRKDLLFAVCP